MKTHYIIIWIKLTIYLSSLLRGWEYTNGKCRPVRYAIPATADVLRPQPQMLSDDDNDDDGSDREYGDNSDNCDTNSE